MFNMLVVLSVLSLISFTVNLGILHLVEIGSRWESWSEKVAAYSLIFYLFSTILIIVYSIQNLI